MPKKRLLSRLNQPVHPWVAALILISVSLTAIGVLMFATPASSQLPHHFLCNEVQMGGVKLKPSLAARLFCYSPLASLWYDIKQPKQQPSPTQEYQPRPTATPTPPSHTTYTSDRLGISFTYIDAVNGRQNFYTREIGNTVYIYDDYRTNQPSIGTDDEFLKTIAPHAYSVEVFHKDPRQSLQEACLWWSQKSRQF